MINQQDLSDFASKINNLFGLQEQGKELIAWVAKVIGCKYSCLLFLEVNSEDFTALVCRPKPKTNPLSTLVLSGRNPIIEYLRREKKLLTSTRTLSGKR